jgi:glucose/mannose transport system permease protein
MYSCTFNRDRMAVGSASAVIMLMTIAAIMVGKPPVPAANV